MPSQDEGGEPCSDNREQVGGRGATSQPRDDSGDSLPTRSPPPCSPALPLPRRCPRLASPRRFGTHRDESEGCTVSLFQARSRRLSRNSPIELAEFDSQRLHYGTLFLVVDRVRLRARGPRRTLVRLRASHAQPGPFDLEEKRSSSRAGGRGFLGAAPLARGLPSSRGASRRCDGECAAHPAKPGAAPGAWPRRSIAGEPCRSPAPRLPSRGHAQSNGEVHDGIANHLSSETQGQRGSPRGRAVRLDERGGQRAVGNAEAHAPVCDRGQGERP
jgi:hypothetical protein